MRCCACVCRVGPVPGLGPFAYVKQSSVYRVLHDYMLFRDTIPYRAACTRTAGGRGGIRGYSPGSTLCKKIPGYKVVTKSPAPRHATRGIVYRTVPNSRLQERTGTDRMTDRTEPNHQPRNQSSNSKPLKPPELAPKPSTMFHAHATMWYKSASRSARSTTANAQKVWSVNRQQDSRQSYHADEEGPITMELPPRD